jgi:tetratricopeptide (TPR) repeat protein
MALGCHTRAVTMRQTKETPDHASIGANYIGIANAHWARQEYTEAIDNAQRALTIRESLVPSNEASIAATLGVLANIYQDNGNNALGIELSKKALVTFERTLASDSPILAELFFNMGVMQSNMELFPDAYQSFERAVKVYRKFLPEGHPDLVAAEDEQRRVQQLIQTNNNTT